MPYYYCLCDRYRSDYRSRFARAIESATAHPTLPCLLALDALNQCASVLPQRRQPHSFRGPSSDGAALAIAPNFALNALPGWSLVRPTILPTRRRWWSLERSAGSPRANWYAASAPHQPVLPPQGELLPQRLALGFAVRRSSVINCRNLSYLLAALLLTLLQCRPFYLGWSSWPCLFPCLDGSRVSLNISVYSDGWWVPLILPAPPTQRTHGQ